MQNYLFSWNSGTTYKWHTDQHSYTKDTIFKWQMYEPNGVLWQNVLRVMQSKAHLMQKINYYSPLKQTFK